MKKLFALLLLTLSLTANASPQFVALDVIIESPQPLAAWQFELTDLRGLMRVVGIESGDSEAYERAPYYDRDAINAGTADRIVVASFSLERDAELPRGATRVATVHVVVDGGDGDFELKLITATTSDGRKINAVARLVEK